MLAQVPGGPCVPGTATANDPAANPCPPGYFPITTPGLVIFPTPPLGTPSATGSTGVSGTPGGGSTPGIGGSPLTNSPSGRGWTTGPSGSTGASSTTGNVGISPYGGSGSLWSPTEATQPGGLSR